MQKKLHASVFAKARAQMTNNVGSYSCHAVAGTTGYNFSNNPHESKFYECVFREETNRRIIPAEFDRRHGETEHNLKWLLTCRVVALTLAELLIKDGQSTEDFQ